MAGKDVILTKIDKLHDFTGEINSAFEEHHVDVNKNQQESRTVVFDNEVDEQSSSSSPEDVLIYNMDETPPIHMTLFFGLQQALLSLAGNLSVSLLVAETVCAEEDEEFKAELLGTTLFMVGITSLLMTFVGVRLPLFQGAANDYVIPLLAMAATNKDKCDPTSIEVQQAMNESLARGEIFNMADYQKSRILSNTQLLQGSLILAGTIHFLIGMTGLVGVLLRFVGPVTIVPAIFLIGIYLMKATTRFAKVHWGISFLTCAISIILALYLSKIKMPIPIWTKRRGCHVTRYPYHQMFSILIAILIGWGVCGILTVTDTIPYDKNSTMFAARTDARSHIIHDSKWFYFPYPGQFGPIRFSGGVFVGFLIATFTSILDSVGDYYACAAMCRVPPPPSHAVNRGIAIEGLCSSIAGFVGAGHATTTFGGNIGAIGVTRVSSRAVFLCCALIYILFGIVGKVSAVFICIPYPVLGGALITMYGMFTGVVLSNLSVVDLSSSRNLAIIGTSIFCGLMVPHWIETYPEELATGSETADELLEILLGNPNMFGGALACFLDNTVPGTLEERGIAVWQKVEKNDEGGMLYVLGYEVYEPPLFKHFKKSKILKYLPFMPNPEEKIPHSLTSEIRPRDSGPGPRSLPVFSAQNTDDAEARSSTAEINEQPFSIAEKKSGPLLTSKGASKLPAKVANGSWAEQRGPKQFPEKQDRAGTVELSMSEGELLSGSLDSLSELPDWSSNKSSGTVILGEVIVI